MLRFTQHDRWPFPLASFAWALRTILEGEEAPTVPSMRLCLDCPYRLTASARIGSFARTSGFTRDMGHAPRRIRAVSSPNRNRPALDRGAGRACRVGGDYHVVHLQQRIVGGRRLLLEHVEAGARDLAVLERPDQRPLVHGLPRHVLMKYAVGFIALKTDSPTSFLVSSLRGTCIET